MVFAGILAAGMSVERQLEAAQKFLRNKQALWVCRKHWTKCSASRSSGCVAGTGAARLLGDSQAESFLENVAVKTRPVEAIRLVA